MKALEILSRDKIVVVWKDNELEVLNNDLLPLHLKRVSDIENWLETRAIDLHRANSRLLKKGISKLNMKVKSKAIIDLVINRCQAIK